MDAFDVVVVETEHNRGHTVTVRIGGVDLLEVAG